VKIIAYVRSPGSYISSAFQELIKAGMSTFNLNSGHPNYRRRFENFDQIFGKKNVQLIYFNPKKLKNNDIVSDFLTQTKLSDNIDTSVRINESLSLEATALLYVFNKYTAKRLNIVEKERIRSKLIEFVRHIGKKKFILKSNILKNIVENNKADIEWIEKRMEMQIMDTSLDNSNGIGSEEDMYNIAKNTFENMSEKQCGLLCKIYDFKKIF
jgi:hypothetical protein